MLINIVTFKNSRPHERFSARNTRLLQKMNIHVFLKSGRVHYVFATNKRSGLYSRSPPQLYGGLIARSLMHAEREREREGGIEIYTLARPLLAFSGTRIVPVRDNVSGKFACRVGPLHTRLS